MTLPTDKASYTVTVAILATWRAELVVQHICKAKTGTVLPGRSWPKEFGIVYSFIPEAPLEIDRGNGGARLPSILLLDCAPTHISEETMVRNDFPRRTFCRVPEASFNQPLARTYFKTCTTARFTQETTVTS